MSAVQVFFGESWRIFIAVSLMSFTIFMLRVLLFDRNATIVGTRRFPELKTFPKDEQERLLHAADRWAFHGWRAVVPVLAASTMLASSMAAAAALEKAGLIPDFLWADLSVTVLIMVPGFWLLGCLEARRIRPVLLSQIKRLQQPELPGNAAA